MFCCIVEVNSFFSHPVDIMSLKWQYFVFVLSIVSVFGDQLNVVDGEFQNGSDDKSNATTASSSTSETVTSSTASTNSADIKKLTKKRCAREYNMNCLKVDLISSVEKLGKSTDFQLLPGVRVVGNTDAFMSQRADDSRMVFSAENVGNQLDELLVRRLVSYAKSLSLNVQIFDKDQKRGKSLGLSTFFPSLLATFEGRGDKKQGKWSGTLITAAVLTGGTLLWMGLSSLMAMATKALAASLLSIVISIVTAYRSSGHSHKSTTYEIVAKPVYSPYSADVQHDPHAAASAHQYGRNMELWDKVVPSMSARSEVLVPIREDAHQLAYRAH